ncbi:hypothetical protein GCM10010336_64950 [Streptomyces goshikiensis]|nr:hypothetical protein GCM10010336_64950 [Streptomyces goshikiensis]
MPGQGLAVTPFTESGGTAAAYVTDPGEGIGQSTRHWVEGYVPAQIGPGKVHGLRHPRIRHPRRPRVP